MSHDDPTRREPQADAGHDDTIGELPPKVLDENAAELLKGGADAADKPTESISFNFTKVKTTYTQ